MSNRNGFFNVTSLTSDECRGNFFGFVVLLHTTYGKDLLEQYFAEKGVKYDLLLETCKLVLAWERFYLDGQKRSDLINAEQATWDLQSRILRDIPRPERAKTQTTLGSKGWKIVKFHVLGFLTGLNLKFGKSQCYNTEANEKNHKYFVKGNAKLTQRISAKFSTQLANNDCDRVIIDTAYEAIKEYCSQDHCIAKRSEDRKRPCLPVIVDSDPESEGEEDYLSDSLEDIEGPRHDSTVSSLSGFYNLSIRISSTKRVTVSHKWKSRYHRMIGIEPCPYMHKTLSDAAIKYSSIHRICHACDIDLVCYTGAIVNGVRYRATPYWKGSDWYDWAAVRFPSTIDSHGGELSIARVMGFLQYQTKGALTYKSMEIDGLDPDVVVDYTDPTVYAVLHCQTTYYDYNVMGQQFIRKFTMMSPSDMYILPASCILHPLIVVPDIEDAETVSTNQYMVITPRHGMGDYFRHHVNWYIQQQDEGNMESNDLEFDHKKYGDTW
jgi:hypothetical protein